MNINALLPKEFDEERKVRQILAEKWEPTGLLEGLVGVERGNMARLLENQAGELVLERNSTGTTAGSEEWNGIALPLVRRIFGQIVAKDMVSVQPMSMPSGLVFFLDYKYATSQPGFVTGASRTSQMDSVFGVTDAERGTAAGTEGLYGAGRFGYTLNDYSSSALQPHTVLSSARFLTASVDYDSDLNWNSEFSASAVNNSSNLVKVIVSASALTDPNVNGVRAFTLANQTGTFVNDTYQQFTTYDATNKRVVFIVSASTALAGTDRLVVNYHKQPTSITRGDFEEGKTQSGAGTEVMDIPTLDLQLRSEPIVAKTRRLKAQWTPEFAQDLSKYQNIDVDVELTSLMSEYISQDIDLEIVDMLIRNAQTVRRWSARIGYEYDSGTSTFKPTSVNNAYYSQGEWFQTLGTKISRVSNEIHRLTMKGGANFIMTSPTVSTILESIPGFVSSITSTSDSSYSFGVQKVGTFANRYTVYKNPYLTENVILMGYKGNSFLETGAVYAPYIPIIITPVIPDPDNFTPRRGAMTRYALKMVRPEFYGKIYVHGLDTI